MFNYRFAERRSLNVKKKLESLMSSKLVPSLNSWVVSGTSVEVIVLSMPGHVIRSIAANLVR
jgi:hypothetical protein